jgi:2-(1,2-epoxy-1,2-dihydrophenyl)acetyl-CoA isomerase
MDGNAIRTETTSGLAVLTLSRPERGNPIDGKFGREMKEIANDLRQDSGLRAVLLRAEGRNFSFGGDLKVFGERLNRLPYTVNEWTADLHMALQRFWTLPVPIICAVRGYAMGGALSMAAGCDVVVAGESARLGSAFAQIGFSCDSGSSITLAERMGAVRARRFVMLGEVLRGDEAVREGLVDQVVADDKLDECAMELATRFANGPTLAYGQIKRLFRSAQTASIEAQLEDEARTIAVISGTEDAREGIAAQLARRKPDFKGR